MYGYKFIAKQYILRGSFFIDFLSTWQLDNVYISLWGLTEEQIRVNEYIPYLKIVGMVKI